ncbi:hypothetical protein [Actinoplanes philippinensis]|uniref:hypothetical protein n=1 Tax=Actinoplanes philippinensis TaxID=35752 RepID=UPI0033F5D730
MNVQVLPITSADVSRVAHFLHAHLNTRLSADLWARAITPPWKSAAPNHGFMLLAAGLVVGVYLAFYTERTVGGTRQRFCNLGGWCVLPRYRLLSVKLLRALLGQEGYHFTDLTPSGSVIPINERLGFRHLESELLAVPHLPLSLPLPGRVVTSDPRRIEDLLAGDDLQLYLDHREALAARHVVLADRSGMCHVVFRHDRPKNLPLFASLVHVSDRRVFRRMFRAFTGHLLVRHGLPVTLLEPRVAGFRPRGAVRVPTDRRRMFRSDTLQPHQIDLLYSELVCVPF